MNHITITLFGKKNEQKFYEINDTNSVQIQEWISAKKTKYDIDSIASHYPLLHTIQYFDPNNSWVSVKQNNEILGFEPYSVSNDCFNNQCYGIIDSSSYNTPIILDLNCQAITSNPEAWQNDTQRVFDCSNEEESFLSPLNPIILSSIQNTIPTDKGYLIKTTSCISAFEYEFDISEQFNVDNLGLFIDPNSNYIIESESVIPDFILYNEVFRCGAESFCMPISIDWTKGIVKTSIDVVSEYCFGEMQTSDTLNTVSF